MLLAGAAAMRIEVMTPSYKAIALLFLVALYTLCTCAAQLPEPQSRGAQLYQQYCSGKACHAPMSPRRGGKAYWDLQVRRMLEVMQKNNRALPTPAEREEILAYLYRHAQSK